MKPTRWDIPNLMFDLYTDVIVTADLPAEGLKADDVGTVVERHVVPGKVDGYSIEFFDMTGKTISVATVPASLLRAQAAAQISDLPFGPWQA